MSKEKYNSSDVSRILLNEIKSGIFKDQLKLPPEEKLASILGVSRTLLRDCLSDIEREGYISRKQGVGTIINKHVLKVKTRMDLEYEFMEMVAQTGAVPEIVFKGVETIFSDEVIAKKLDVPVETPVLKVSRLITADGKPAILCDDHISFKMIKDYSYEKSELEKPIFEFLKKYCEKDIYLDLTVVKPVVADESLADIFCIDRGSPMLFMDEIGFDFDGNPVLWSVEYYADGVFDHTVLRKKI